MQKSAAAVAASGVAANASAQETPTKQQIFVLVHGAWHGGWCWWHVRNLLQDQRHRVFTPKLTGHGERIHLRHPDVNLDTHVQDIINVIEWEELENVVLVGHSYGGMIISGVCDAEKDRIAHAIYLDAMVPKDGDQVVNSPTMKIIEETSGPLQDGFLVPPPDTTFGIPSDMKEKVAWLKRRMTPQLTGTLLQKMALPNGGSEGLPRTYIFCTDQPQMTEQKMAAIQGIKDDPSWGYAELPTGHDSMITMPEETTQMFERIASTA